MLNNRHFLPIKVLILAAVSGVWVCARAEMPLYKDSTMPVEKRIEDLLKRMTLKEKLEQIAGKKLMDGYGNERLGISPLLMTDGPNGVCGGRLATCFPTLVSAGATWDEGLVERLGQALGEEARSKGRNLLLGPCINIHRTPLGGRNFESISEDPYLVARLAAAYVQGVQSRGVGASVKHFAANNQEAERGSISVEIDERTLREIYLPGFEAAVAQGHAASVMGAYNKINGDHCCENKHILTDILKNEWGFSGVVLSDWGALHDTSKAAVNGCDMEMPGPAVRFSKEKLIPEILSGKVGMQIIDDKVRRALRVKFELGLFDGWERLPNNDPAVVKRHQGLAREIAENAIVLLKNEGGALPLKKGSIKSLAIIGPNAAAGRSGGGGSSSVKPPYIVSPLEGIQKLSSGAFEITCEKGCLLVGDFTTVPSPVLTPAGATNGRHGLTGEYFKNPSFIGKPKVTRRDACIDFNWGYDQPCGGFGNTAYSVRWTGTLEPPDTGTYEFSLLSNGGSRLFVNGNLLVDNWGDHETKQQTGSIYLEKGATYDIKAEYYRKSGVSVMKLGWESQPDSLRAHAVAAAKKCDVAVIFAGLNKYYEGEGVDRQDMNLPAGQDELIEAVAAANPRTIVVLINGTPLDMRKWVNKVPAVVEAWYPGMEGGNALASVLFGEVNPSGKLPDTFPAKLEDNPSYGNYPGADNKVLYGEGIFVGYRHYDARKIAPLFPFGHGLSYTTFAYKNLAVTPVATTDGNVTVTVDIENTGAREGKEVVQLYIADAASSLPRPPEELKGFKKVALAPGEKKTVVFELNRRSLSFFDPSKNQWVAEPGKFEALVGSSSRDIRLKGSFVLQ